MLGPVGADRVGVQVPDSPLGFLAHPTAVGLDVGGQALGPLPGGERGPGVGVNRRTAREPGRDLQHGPLDQHRHRVQVTRKRLQAQSLGFQPDGASTPERIEDRGGGAGATARYFGPGLGQHPLVVRVLPADQALENAEQALALDPLLGRAQRIVAGRVVHQRGPDHRPGRGQGPAGPPQVQRRRVAVADALLPGRLGVDGGQRQGHLNQLRLVIGHPLPAVFIENH